MSGCPSRIICLSARAWIFLSNKGCCATRLRVVVLPDALCHETTSDMSQNEDHGPNGILGWDPALTFRSPSLNANHDVFFLEGTRSQSAALLLFPNDSYITHKLRSRAIIEEIRDNIITGAQGDAFGWKTRLTVTDDGLNKAASACCTRSLASVALRQVRSHCCLLVALEPPRLPERMHTI